MAPIIGVAFATTSLKSVSRQRDQIYKPFKFLCSRDLNWYAWNKS